MNFKMLHDNVLIAQEPKKEEKDGKPYGIIIPDSVSEKDNGSSCGIVKEVGPGLYDQTSGKIIPLSLKKGDKVYYRKWAGSEIKVNEAGNSVEYKVVQEKDIFAILDN